MKSLTVLLTIYYSGYKIKNNKMSGKYGTYGRQESCIQNFGGEILGKETKWKT
jgi:hypothetical protein